MKRTLILMTAIIGLGCVGTQARAGFEFEAAPEAPQAPVRLPQAQQQPGTMTPQPEGFEVEPLPVTPVEAQPLSTLPMPGEQPAPAMQPQSLAPPQAPQAAGLVINPYPNQTKAATDEQSLMQEMLRESGSLNPLPNPRNAMARPQVSAQSISPVRKSNYPEIQGFGRDMPLAIAMTQIIPPQYTFTFDNNVDPGVGVSWEGGKPWDTVLKDMLAPVQLRPVIGRNSVVIEPDFGQPLSQSAQMSAQSVMYQEQPSAPAPLPMAQSAPRPLQPQPVVEPSQMEAASMQAQAEPSDTKNAMVSRSADIVSSDTDSGSMGRPAVPARFSRLQGDGPEMAMNIAPEPAQSDLTPPAPLEPVQQMPMQAASAPAPLAPVEIKPQPVREQPETAMYVSEPADEMFEDTMEKSVQPVSQPVSMSPDVPEWDEPSQLKMVRSTAHVNSLDRVRTWRAVRGDSLKTILSDWALDAGVELYWSSEFDYPLDSSVRLKGTFEEAVQNLLMGLRDARPRPVGRLHPNEPEGPPVLVIETQQIVE